MFLAGLIAGFGAIAFLLTASADNDEDNNY